MSNDELRAAPPHRAEHKASRHPVRSGDDEAEADGHATATQAATAMHPKLRRARTKRARARGGGGGGMNAGGPPTFLALAVQASWPEDPESAEGKLVRTLQDEQGLLPTRIEALKVYSSHPRVPLSLPLPSPGTYNDVHRRA